MKDIFLIRGVKLKKICLFIICFILVIPLVRAEEINTTTSNNIKDEQKNDGLLTDGKSAILIEASTGKILYEKNSHDRYAPASMTKIMSMILIMEEIEKGALKWEEILTTSQHAASMGGSQIFLQPQE